MKVVFSKRFKADLLAKEANIAKFRSDWGARFTNGLLDKREK